MQTVPVAYVQIRGANLLVAFFEPTFDERTFQQRADTYAALRAAAARENLTGEIAAVWENAGGRARFLAPAHQKAFFEVASYSQLRAQVNGSIEL